MFANPFLQSDSKEIVTSHPPTELRLQLMAQLTNDIQLKASRELDSYESLSNHAKHVYEEVSNIIDIYASQKLPLVTSIHNYQISKNTAEWVFSKLLIGTKNVLEIAKAKLNKLPNKDWLCSSKDVLHALALSESFAHRFIPTKLPKPFDGTLPSFASVMNSGWYYLLTQKTNGDFFFFTADPSKEKKPEVVTESLITMHQLVAKAVEVLNFQRSYQRQRGKNK